MHFYPKKAKSNIFGVLKKGSFCLVALIFSNTAIKSRTGFS